MFSDDEDDFHDAVTDPDYAQFSVSCPPTKHKRSGSSVSGCRLVFIASSSSHNVISPITMSILPWQKLHKRDHVITIIIMIIRCMFSTRSDGVASSCAGGDEDDFSSDGEGPTLNIVKKREKQAGDQVDGSPTGSSNLTPVKQRFVCLFFSEPSFMKDSAEQERDADSEGAVCRTSRTSPSPCGAS